MMRSRSHSLSHRHLMCVGVLVRVLLCVWMYAGLSMAGCAITPDSNGHVDISGTSIDNGAFEGCTSLSAVVIPDSVTSVGNVAFSRCSSLASVTLGNSVSSIGAGAFQYCTSLSAV